MDNKKHWEQVYSDKAASQVSWYQEHANTSLALIHQTGLGIDAQIIDVGGGASTLVDDLLADGYRNLTVLDIAASASDVARARLGCQAGEVTWVEADITSAWLPECHYDLWHDRAVYHFLTERSDRLKYREAMLRAIKPGGFVIFGTFAETGPSECSGLPVQQYSAESLTASLGIGFDVVAHAYEAHLTPNGSIQNFLYCCLQRKR